MNIKHPSAPRSLCRCEALFSTNKNASYATEILVSDFVAAFESCKFNLDNTTSMDSAPFCRVCLNDNYKNSRCQWVKSNARFIRTQNKNFEYCRNRQETRTNSPAKTAMIVSSVRMVGRITIVHRRQTKVWSCQLAPETTTVTTDMLCARVQLSQTKPARKT